VFEWVVAGLVAGIVGAIFSHLAVVWYRSVELRELKAVAEYHDTRLFALEQTIRSAKGVAAREEKSAEWEAAIAEIMPVLQAQGDMPFSERIKALLPVLAKYPRVRGALMRQLGINV
jgi:hypothetical protein